MNNMKKRKTDKKIKKALKNYNASVQRLAEAATELGDIAFKAGIMTQKMFCAVVKMNALAQEARISVDKMTKGGTDNGETTGH